MSQTSMDNMCEKRKTVKEDRETKSEVKRKRGMESDMYIKRKRERER